MALGDYILCCKCEVKLIYDGDRGQREWWTERFGEEPQITCPDCQKETKFVGLTEKEIFDLLTPLYSDPTLVPWAIEINMDEYRAIEAKLRDKNCRSEKNGGQA